MWTRAFVLLCAAQMFGYGHNGLLQPLVPLFVTSLGYSEVTVGLVIAAFSVASFLTRPILGYLTDSWSVRGVSIVGGLLLAIATAPLAILAGPSAWVIGLLNGVRGVGWGAFNTGGNTVLANAAPITRRAEAASYYQLLQNLMLSLAPSVGLYLLGPGRLGDTGMNFTLGFAFAALTGVAVIACFSRIPTESAEPRGLTTSHHDDSSRFYDTGVLLASTLLFAVMVTNPAINAFAPLYARTMGISVDSISLFYLASGLTALAGRWLVGNAADRHGRGPVMAVGMGLTVLALIVMATATNLVQLVVGGVLYMLAQVTHLPATFALAIDRSNPRKRGAAMASFSLGFQVATGLGSVVAGFLAEYFGHRVMYGALILAPIAGLVLVAVNWRGLGRPSARQSV